MTSAGPSQSDHVGNRVHVTNTMNRPGSPGGSARLTLALWLAIAGGAAFCQGQEQPAGHAWLLDVAGCGDGEEMYLIGVLQGLVNRDLPRLFLNHSSAQCVGAGNVFARFLAREKGITFTTCHSLAEAIAMFAKEKRADGSPLIRGLVRYATPDNRQYMRWIAANLAAQEDLLPVTEDLLHEPWEFPQSVESLCMPVSPSTYGISLC